MLKESDFGVKKTENISARLFYYVFILFPGAALVQNGVKNAIFATPLQPSLQQEVILARIEQILASRSLTEDEYAQLLYERGVLYDSLGFKGIGAQ